MTFARNEYDKCLNPNALDDDARWLTEHPNVRFYIDGYASTRGDQTYNLILSQRRADWVKQSLVSRGVPEDRIRLWWDGASCTQTAWEIATNALTKTSWSVSHTFRVRRIHADHFEGDQSGGSSSGFDYVCQNADGDAQEGGGDHSSTIGGFVFVRWNESSVTDKQLRKRQIYRPSPGNALTGKVPTLLPGNRL